MDYNYQGFQDFKEPLTARQLIQMETAIITQQDNYKKNNILEGKILVTVGDSITEGADLDKEPEGLGLIDPNTGAKRGNYKSYGWQIAQRNNMIFYNRGISGSTMQGLRNPNGTDAGEGRTDGKGNIDNKYGFSKPNGRYTELPEEIDILTIWFGWNDQAYGTLGSIDDTTCYTYCGGFNVTLPYLIYKYPYTTIILIVPFGASLEHRNAVREMASKWGVGLFDMTDAANIPFYYPSTNEEKTPIKVLRQKLHQINGAHPGYQGHYMISVRLEDYIRKCGCYDRKNAKLWNVTYETEYGDPPQFSKKIKILYDQVLPQLVVDGHEFDGWEYQPDANEDKWSKATPGIILNNDIKLRAKWKS